MDRDANRVTTVYLTVAVENQWRERERNDSTWNTVRRALGSELKFIRGQSEDERD